MKVSRLEIRTFLYFILFGLVTTILVTVCSYSIKEQVEDMQTWQYNATYDFETKIETNKDGENELVMYVETPEQLAGAMSVVSNKSSTRNYVKKLKKKNVELFNKVSLSDSINSIRRGIKLTKNINLSGYSWSSVEYGYYWYDSTNRDENGSIVLDGQGYVIHNLSGQGFVSTLKSGATIKNLVISNSNITGSYYEVGIVARINNGKIINVSVVGSSSVNGSNKSNVGGLVGKNEGTISNCINYASVRDGINLGGIAGYNSGTISHCFNKNDVYDKNSTNRKVGGIAGYNKGKIELCENNGNVYSSTEVTYGTSYAGGIAGKSEGNITKCGNKGSIYCGRRDYYDSIYEAYSGGITGYLSSGSVTYCFNLGYIYHYADYDTRSKTSEHSSVFDVDSYLGYSGWSRDNWSYYLKNDGYNYWDEYGRYSFGGGIAGWAKSKSKINNCYNSGYVERHSAMQQIVKVCSKEVDYHNWIVVKTRTNYYYNWLGWKIYYLENYDDPQFESRNPASAEVKVKYRSHYNHSPICPSTEIYASDCYNTYDMLLEHSMSFDLGEKTCWMRDGNKGTDKIYDWVRSGSNFKECWWARSYDTYEFGIDARNRSCIKLFVIYRYYGSEYGSSTYSYIYTGLDSEGTYPVRNRCRSKVSSQSDLPSTGDWDKDSSINSNYPFPVGLYWKKA